MDSYYNLPDPIERIPLDATKKIPVNFAVKTLTDMDELRGEHIGRPAFVKIAVDFFIKELKKSKKPVLAYASP